MLEAQDGVRFERAQVAHQRHHHARERQEAGRPLASSESVFDENAVRIAMMGEKYPTETKKYLAKLRDDSYIKISDTYRPLVSPILFAEERKEAAKGTAQ